MKREQIAKRFHNLMLVMTPEELDEITDKFILLEIKYGIKK